MRANVSARLWCRYLASAILKIKEYSPANITSMPKAGISGAESVEINFEIVIVVSFHISSLLSREQLMVLLSHLYDYSM